MLRTALKFKAVSRWFSDEGLTKKATLNAISAALDYGARLVVGLVINPLMVGGLGNYMYGVLQILGRLILYISAASGRPTQALKWTIANQQASVDYDRKRRNVGGALAVWLIFLPILAALGIFLVWIAPSWLNAPPDLAPIVRLAAGVMVVDLILTSLADVPQSVLQGENLGYKRMGMSTMLVFVAGGGFTAIALYFNTGLIGVVAADLGYTLLAGAFFLHIVRKYVPWFQVARPSTPELRQFIGLSWWFLIWRLVMQLMMSSDIIVLGRLISVEQVTIYTLTKYIPETLISLVAIVVTGITPGLGGVIGSGKFQKAIRVRNEVMLGTWFIATVVGATILLWNRDFVHLWVGKEYYSGDIPTLMIMLMITQFVLIRNDANIIDLSLNVRQKVIIGLVSATLSIVFSVVLVGYFQLGITGLCLGFIAGRMILSLGYPWLVGRFLGVSLFSQLRSVPRPAFVMLLLFILALGARDIFSADTWIGLTLSVGVSVIMISMLTFYSGLSNEQRKNLLRRVRLVLQPADSDP